MIYGDFIQHGKFLSIYFGLMSLLFFVSVFTFSNIAFASQPSTGIIVPLYTNPGNEWEKVIQAKKTHPSIPILVIINPNNGPIPCPQQDYVQGIIDLKSTGVMTLGYVSTNYTARNSDEVIADIDNWKTCYPGIDGIFFDEMSNISGEENYYANLTSYAKSKGFIFTVGNPGIVTLPSYVNTVDNLIIYENAGLPDLSSLKEVNTGFKKNHFSIISYDIDNIDNSTIRYLSSHVGYLFVTNGTQPNPFTSLPPYFDKILEQLNRYNYDKNDHCKEPIITKLDHRHYLSSKNSWAIKNNDC